MKKLYFKVSNLQQRNALQGLAYHVADVNYINTIIQLNVMATTVMTRQLFSNLKMQEKAYVLNVSSMAAFSPIAFKTVYPASKAFVHSFTRGLYEEYKKGIIVLPSGQMVETLSAKTCGKLLESFFAKLHKFKDRIID